MVTRKTDSGPEAGVIYQLKVPLRGVHPPTPIGRRLCVPAHANLWELHHVLQFAMGWQRGGEDRR